MARHQALTDTALKLAEPRADTVPWVNSVFEQPWWLDGVAPGRWSEAVVRRGDDVVARLPYTSRRRYGLTTIVQPHLTQTLGPWLTPTTCKYAKRLESEKRLLGQLIEGLPRFDFFRMNFSPALTNWLPFYWAGFEATVRYTYRIEDLSDLDRVHSEFQEGVRRGIRKAQTALEVDHDYPLDHLLRLNAETFARQGLRPPYSDAFVRRLDAACAARGARRILGAIDADGRAHAALYVVWDERTLYPLINARDPELQAFGSNTLLYWEAIRLASEVSAVFDFEGSMLEPIEHFVRAFGGRQTPYFSVWKAGARARSVLAVRSARRALGRRARTRLGR
ncbi:MAG: GNAT family N-acetyltransferase [Solirubrobacteraceae bacterium]